MPEPGQNPQEMLREQVAELRDALRQLRESVVLRVMRRNQLEGDEARLEKRIAELERGSGLAERAQNTGLVEQIRQELTRLGEELERTRALRTQAEAEAEAAKISLFEDKATLLRTINEVQARYTRYTAAQVEAHASGALETEADSLWERASSKIANLTREAQAREEIIGSRGTQEIGDRLQGTGNRGQGTAQPALDSDESAEQMLAQLEQHLGLTGGTTSQPQLPPARASYLELEESPADAPHPQPLLPQPATTEAVNTPSHPAAPDSANAHPNTAPDNGKSDVAELLPSVIIENPQASSENTPSVSDGTQALAEEQQSSTENRQSEIQPLQSKIQNPKSKITSRESSRMETAPRVRVAAIGTGNIFRGAHLPCYPDIAQAQLVALCDPDKTALDMAYKKYQTLMEAKIHQALEAGDILTAERLETDLETIQLCDDISEVIEMIKPDLVDICTQPLLHTPLAIEALEAGFHVMCEKPISRSWLESQQLIQTIARTGKFYQHNENWLFEPDYYTVKKLVDAGAIGELTMMFLTQAHGGPEGNPRFWNSDFGGGGALLDNGIHAIGAAWFIAGLDKTPTLVKAAAPFGMSIRMPDRIIDGKYQHITVDDDAHILIRFEDTKTNAWTTAHVEGSWSEQDSPDTAYIGTTGSIKMAQEDGKRFAVVCDIKGQETRRFRVSGSNWQHWPSSFYGEILNMVMPASRTTSNP